MPTPKLLMGLLPALIGLAVGCKSDQFADFKDVQKNILARTDSAPEWPRSATENTKIEAVVQQLVSEDLTPDSAVRIALLHNRSLRAIFEEIGISSADLIQAGLPRNPQFGASVRFPDRPGS